jgi:nitrate/nitrite-specific signal transduction histidine kinase
VLEEHVGLRRTRERALLVRGERAIKRLPEGGVEVRIGRATVRGRPGA